MDWRRYDIANTPHFKIEPPKEVRSMVSKLMEKLQMEYGTLGFIVSKNGERYLKYMLQVHQHMQLKKMTVLIVIDTMKVCL